MSCLSDVPVKGETIRRVGVIGCGYVGSAVMHAFGGVKPTRFHDPRVVGSIGMDALCSESDVLFVCVPTPQMESGAVDVSIVLQVMDALAERVVSCPVVLKSTVPPGTCRQIVERWPSLELTFSPEFLRERHHLRDAEEPARVVLGWTDPERRSPAVVTLFQTRFPDVDLIEMRAEEAELLKYASNALFGVKVSFANEMSELSQSLGLDWETVRQALVLDPRIGDGHLRVPGPDGHPGFGGSCLPKDMAGLLALAEQVGVALDVTEASVRSNQRRRCEEHDPIPSEVRS